MIPPATPDKAKVYWRRCREELAARKLEYEAAEIRYKGEPGFFRSTFHTWIMWSFAVILLFNGIICLFRENRDSDR